jgi:hypothetical protein
MLWISVAKIGFLPCGCRKCHPMLLIWVFDHLVASTTMWKIESNSVENSSNHVVVRPGEVGYVDSPPTHRMGFRHPQHPGDERRFESNPLVRKTHNRSSRLTNERNDKHPLRQRQAPLGSEPVSVPKARPSASWAQSLEPIETTSRRPHWVRIDPSTHAGPRTGSRERRLKSRGHPG